MNSFRKNSEYLLKVTIPLVACFMFSYTPSRAQIEPAPWPDPSANHVLPYNASAMTHGSMLGKPLSSGIRVWVRTSKPQKFKVVYSRELPLSANSKGIIGKTLANEDNTGYVDIGALQSNTKYYYGIVLDGRLIDMRMDYDDEYPFFNTLPDQQTFTDSVYNPDGLANFYFGLGFCNRISPYANRYSNPQAYQNM